MEAGPPIWRNWRQALAGVAGDDIVEVALHTDARVVGHLTDLGPYALLNPIAHAVASPGASDPPLAIVLRAVDHPDGDDELPDMTRTNTARYHGGGMAEEFAALVSLCLGTRCRSGGIMREFRKGGDPLGTPVAWARETVYMPPPRGGRTVLPRPESVSLTDAEGLLRLLPECDPARAQALIKAARLYQEAIWTADADPNSCWLQLISALKVAAVYWYVDRERPIDHLRQVLPELAKTLERVDGADQLAEQLAPLVRATRRFLDFALAHLPDPPTTRPPEAFRVRWEEMKKHLNQVYTLRSAALHDGTPFPIPMLEPVPPTDFEARPEKPLGLASAGGGGTWVASDTPMTLAMFEHIARGVLIKWFGTLPTGGRRE